MPGTRAAGGRSPRPIRPSTSPARRRGLPLADDDASSRPPRSEGAIPPPLQPAQVPAIPAAENEEEERAASLRRCTCFVADPAGCGLTLSKHAIGWHIDNVRAESAAAFAGLGTGMVIVTVDNRLWRSRAAALQVLDGVGEHSIAYYTAEAAEARRMREQHALRDHWLLAEPVQPIVALLLLALLKLTQQGFQGYIEHQQRQLMAPARHERRLELLSTLSALDELVEGQAAATVMQLQPPTTDDDAHLEVSELDAVPELDAVLELDAMLELDAASEPDAAPELQSAPQTEVAAVDSTGTDGIVDGLEGPFDTVACTGLSRAALLAEGRDSTADLIVLSSLLDTAHVRGLSEALDRCEHLRESHADFGRQLEALEAKRVLALQRHLNQQWWSELLGMPLLAWFDPIVWLGELAHCAARLTAWAVRLMQKGAHAYWRLQQTAARRMPKTRRRARSVVASVDAFADVAPGPDSRSAL